MPELKKLKPDWRLCNTTQVGWKTPQNPRECRKINYRHKWHGPIEAWTKKYIGKNLWRFHNLYGFYELMSEAYIKFDVCKRKYALVRDAPHFMRLYQVTLTNHFHDLAWECTEKLRKESSFDEFLEFFEADADSTGNNYQNNSLPFKKNIIEMIESLTSTSVFYDIDVALVIHFAPDLVKRFLSSMTDDNMLEKLKNIDVVDRKSGKLVKFRKTNDILAEWLGVDLGGVDLMVLVRQYLKCED